MHNTVYYRIVNKPDCVEYHCSANKRDVIEQQALSKMILKVNPRYKEIVAEWEKEIEYMGKIMQEI